MFTGIVNQLGIVKSLTAVSPVSQLQVAAGQLALGSKPGESIAVNGVCLTVVAKDKELLTFEVMKETLKRTNLGSLNSCDQVNLEPALKIGAGLDGHLVTGHIDATGSINRLTKSQSDWVMEIGCSEQILRYVVIKGSVALDGVSLTVSGLSQSAFEVNLLPYTIKHTTLGAKNQGDYLNIEVDILGKYVHKFLGSNQPSVPSKISSSFLQEHGFAP